jgi:hypothetical protein
MRPAGAEAEDEAAAAVRVGAGGLVVAVLADVIPAEHAASDRLAAQAARATAAERCIVMAFLRKGV